MQVRIKWIGMNEVFFEGDLDVVPRQGEGLMHMCKNAPGPELFTVERVTYNILPELTYGRRVTCLVEVSAVV